MSRTTTERRSVRRSHAVENAAQTRPDQTRVVLTVVCGVCGSKSIHRYGLYAARLATMDGGCAAEFGGGRR